MKSSATAQRRRFLFCLLFVLMTLVALASHALFSAYFTVRNNGANFTCQSIEWLISVWYVFTPELFALVLSLSSTLPLVFALWLMTTPEDRALLLHPGRFCTESIELQPVQTEREENLYAERLRLGINLQ